ncbi:hypothetical protein M5G24_27610 [Pseudomonas sp. TNT2022 ID1048]|uniref:hypothetical protein n=1 Tax=Pseudomonas idahonensis TaxID=2942628 RepID=UPI00235DE386|nr:hypothetical protein [Pseudomonas idahonensis]MDD1022780.1 hypothetical protein [Pseudomonas idahonensis]
MIIVEHDSKGEILSVIDYPASDKEIIDIYPNHLFLPPGAVISQLYQYVYNGEVLDRPSQPGGISNGAFFGVLEGADIFLGSEKISIDSAPPAAQIRVVKWPYLDLVIDNN